MGDLKKIVPQFVIDDDPVVDWPVIVKLPTAGGEFNEYQFSVSMRVLSPKEYEALFADAPGNGKYDDGLVPKLSEVVELKAPISQPKLSEVVELKAPIPRPKLSEIVELNAPIFQRLITGWQGVNDRDGNAVEYTPEKLAEQITGPRGPALSAGLWRAISEIRYGMRLEDGSQKDGARLGN